MAYNLTCRLHSIIPCFRRILWQNECLFPQKNIIPSRYFTSDIPSRSHENKCGEMGNRLAAVPYKNLLNKAVDRVHKDLYYEDDERLEDALKWCSKVFNYNAKNGRMVHSVCLLQAYCTYGFNIADESWDQWDSDGWRSAVTLAWCVELFKTLIIILDDIMDQSVLRRGEPCWYKKPDVGLRAINDALLIQCGIYKLLEKHFASSKCYMNLVHEFLKASNGTGYGQCLDMFNTMNHKPRFDEFTFERYRTIAEYKTAIPFYCLPVLLAMHLAGEYAAKEIDFTRKLCLKIGLYFQSHNDGLDCFGKPEITGKSLGNDIREGKCTWFSVKFLENASQPMKKHFVANYGVDDKDAVAEVLELYRKTNLLERFEEFENQIYTEISASIESLNDIKGYLFYHLFAQIRKTEK